MTSSRKICLKDRQKKRRALIARDGDQCCYCAQQFSAQLPPTFEHTIPLSEGGTWRTKNLRLACEPCNNGRGTGTAPALAEHLAR
jgi:5-methylcytosine-specific restriction endonuclease McrA